MIVMYYYTYTAASPVTNLAPVMVLAVKQTVRVVKYLLAAYVHGVQCRRFS